MKDLTPLNPYFTLEIEGLLAYAYEDFDPAVSAKIKEKIEADDSMKMILKGILKVHRIHGFETKEAHQVFLFHQRNRLAELPISAYSPQPSLAEYARAITKAGARKLFSVIKTPIWLTTANLYRALQCKPDLQLTEVQLPGGMATTMLADFYQNDQYEKALQVLSPFDGNHLSGGVQRSEIEIRESFRFLTGFCHLQLNQTEKAIQHFTRLACTEASKWSTMASWQLGLAYLRADRLDAALEAFQSILVRSTVGRRWESTPNQKRLFRRTRSVLWRIRLRQLLRNFSRYINE